VTGSQAADLARCEALQNRYISTGDPIDLHTAVEIGERCVTAEPDSALALILLARSLRMRCDLTGAQADLDRAIELAYRATELDIGDRERAESFYEVGLGLRTRATLIGSGTDLDAAITVLAAPVAFCTHDPVVRARFLLDLAYAHFLRYCHFERFNAHNDPADLDQAIELNAEAVVLLPSDHPNLPDHLYELASRYLARYQSDRGTPADARLVRDLMRRSIDLTPPGSPRLAPRLGALAAALVAGVWRANRAVDPATVEDLASRLSDAAPRATPAHRVGARYHAGLLASATGCHGLAADLLTAAVNDLPALTPVDRQWHEQEIRLAAFPGLVQEAVAAHCARGDTAAALAVAERGRAVIASSTDPRGALPSHLPGVIVLNAGTRRADALVLTPDCPEPVHVPLPELTANEVHTRATALRDVLDQPMGLAASLAKARVVSDLLAWLWDTAVGPVLDVAKAHGITRIWWQALGELGQFPLHAAGPPGQWGALDAVVSSTVPSLRVLHDLRRRREPAEERRTLVLAMRETPGLPSLPGTAAEVMALPDTQLLADKDATTANLLQALPGCTWAHFACHATTYQARDVLPSAGALHLHDGQISIADLTGLAPTNAELAYLSACSTAHSGTALADESINLATTFHRLGFRHVIASLWPLDDTTAATAAHAFYEQMPPTPDADHAPHALREVTRRLRAAHPDRPDLWAPLIHSGP
jgi:CHAT domain-containing protein